MVFDPNPIRARLLIPLPPATVLAAVLLLATATRARSDNGQVPVSAAAVASLKRVEAPEISPDGSTVVYAVDGPDDHDRPGPSRLWMVRNDAAHQAAHRAAPLPGSEAGDHAPSWAPDGRRLAFIGAHGVGDGRVWLFDVATGSTASLPALPGDVTAFRWSPDGRRIAAIVHGKGDAADARGATEIGCPAVSDRVFLLDVPGAGGPAPRPQAITPADRFVFDVEWSPKGDRLAIRSGAEPGLDYLWYRSRVAVLDLAGHQLVLLPHDATALPPRFSPDGTRLLYGYFNANGITGAVAIASLDGGAVVPLGAQWTGALHAARWSADGRSVIGVGQDGLQSRLVRIDPATGAVSPGEAFLGESYNFSLARDGTICLVAEEPDRPGEVWVFDGAGRHRLTDTNPEVGHWSLGAQRVVDWRAKDGTALQGLLVLPPGAPAGARLPLVVQIHGGPLEAWTDGFLSSWHDWARLLAAHGYAVFMPNPRGSEGYGDRFATAVAKDWGGIDFSDINDGIDALERDGVADPKRELIGGWSYGGFMSAWAAGHSNRFRAVIDGAGPTDLVSMSLTTDVGFSFITPYFGDPIRDRALYDAHSPLFAAHDIHVPVLLLHGAKDARVPIAQAEMLFHALRDGGSTVRFLSYPGAPHWFGGAVGADTQIDVQDQVLGWTERYLGCNAGASCTGNK